MKKIFIGIVLTVLLASELLIADGKINQAHLNMTGRNNEKINCAYCHTTAKIPKKKGTDKTAFSKNPSCEKCHR